MMNQFALNLIRAICIGAVFAGPMAGCQYRIEHRTRPAFYEKAALTELPDELVMDDGTIVKYRTNVHQSSMGRSRDQRGKPFEIRQEMPDGAIVLSAALPEHVLTNTLSCVTNQEYQLLWDQMVAEQTKKAYADSNKGFEDFERFFRSERHEIVESLTRMIAGMPTQDLAIEQGRNGVTRCRLRPQIAEPFKYRTVDLVKEETGLKLLMIR